MRPAQTRLAGRRLTRPTLEDEFGRRRVLLCLLAHERVQPQDWRPSGVELAEGDAVGQVFVLGPAEVHLELVPGLVVKAGLNVGSVMFELTSITNTVLCRCREHRGRRCTTGRSARQRGVEVVGHPLLLCSRRSAW